MGRTTCSYVVQSFTIVVIFTVGFVEVRAVSVDVGMSGIITSVACHVDAKNGKNAT